MGLNPGKLQLLKSGTLTTPGAASTPAVFWGKNHPFLIQGIRAVVGTAAAGTTTLKLQKDTSMAFSSPTDLATITITSSDAASTTFDEFVADASKDAAKTDFFRLRHSGSDASLVLHWEVFGTPAID